MGALAAAVLRLLGFAHAVASTDATGTVMVVRISSSEACAAGPAGAGQLAERLKRALPFLHRVTAFVAGSGQALGPYAGARCTTKLPSAKGRVVYAKSGSGVAQTDPFTVRSSRWTVVYENDSIFFGAFVLKGGKVQPEVLSSQARGGGKHTFQGPGTFRLRVSAAGAWKLKVHDGG